MDNMDPKKMHKRFIFGSHQGRALSFYPPGVTPGGGPPTTAPLAATTPATQGATVIQDPNTKVTKDTKSTTTEATKDTGNDVVTNPTTTQVVASNTANAPSNTAPRAATTTTEPTIPLATSTPTSAPTVAVFNPNTNQVQSTVTHTTRASSVLPSSSSALPSASAAPDNGPSIGSVAGYAAAALAGIAVISVFAIWMIRRKRRREDDADIDAAPFNRHSWLRNSTMLPDDTPTPATTDFPPPRRGPEMIDRSFNATPVNYSGMNQYPQNDFGYATQPSYQPGAVIFSPSSPHTSYGPGGGPATPLPFSPIYDPATPNPFEQQAGYTEVTRGGPPSPYTPQPFGDVQQEMPPSVPNTNLPEERSFSRAPSPKIEVTPSVVPPVAAATSGNADTFARVPAYPELSPAPASAQGQVVEVPTSTHEGQVVPVQYGFVEGPRSPVAAIPSTSVTTSVQQLPVPPAPPAPPAPAAPPAPLQPAAGRTLTRPETVYDAEDAYGGI